MTTWNEQASTLITLGASRNAASKIACIGDKGIKRLGIFLLRREPRRAILLDGLIAH